MTNDDPIVHFSVLVAKRFVGICVVRVPNGDGSIVRYLVAPADRFKDEILPAQKARQEQAGAMPPEIYGHDLFELVTGNVVRLRNGSRIPFRDGSVLHSILSRFLDPNSFDGMQLSTLVERIHEGRNASRKATRSASTAR